MYITTSVGAPSNLMLNGAGNNECDLRLRLPVRRYSKDVVLHNKCFRMLVHTSWKQLNAIKGLRQALGVVKVLSN